ncbi:MAG: aminopeptidase P family protein [Deltaproteobacteria bacterium]|nr:aminopeptidase P family protein [Deltaproteobacteria bacterium]
MTLFSEDVLAGRARRAAEATGDTADLVLVGAGEPIGKPGGLDQTYPFIPHPEYFWLTGSRRPGGVMAFDANEGWKHFVRPASPDERLWEGEPDVPPGEDVAGLDAWIRERALRRVATLGARIPGAPFDGEVTASVQERFDAARRPKDAAEIALITRAVAATAAGYAKAREVIRPGRTEREVAIEIEAEFFRHGATGVGYGTIVGAGSNAAVLHFEPGARVIGEHDVVLVDAGGEIDGYTADVTRTFAASGRFTARQQAIYDIVLAAQLAAIGRCRVGVEWHDVHRTAARVMAAGLRDADLMRGSDDELLETGAIALFFPHGVGHMVGLGVRDVGGRAAGRPEGRMCCGARVRVDLPLAENYLMTVEPGIYFVPAILDDPARRAAHRDRVNWAALDDWREVAGVRIEDDIFVTPGEPRVLTASIAK